MICIFYGSLNPLFLLRKRCRSDRPKRVVSYAERPQEASVPRKACIIQLFRRPRASMQPRRLCAAPDELRLLCAITTDVQTLNA